MLRGVPLDAPSVRGNLAGCFKPKKNPWKISTMERKKKIVRRNLCAVIPEKCPTLLPTFPKKQEAPKSRRDGKSQPTVSTVGNRAEMIKAPEGRHRVDPFVPPLRGLGLRWAVGSHHFRGGLRFIVPTGLLQACCATDKNCCTTGFADSNHLALTEAGSRTQLRARRGFRFGSGQRLRRRRWRRTNLLRQRLVLHEQL
jgi:hypothetical protein